MNFKKYHVSRNLLDLYKEGYALDANGNEVENSEFNIYQASVSINELQYILTGTAPEDRYIRVHEFINNTWVHQIVVDFGSQLPFRLTKSPTTNRLLISINNNNNNMMLAVGSTILPYEPYGYLWSDIPHYIMGTDTDTLTTLPANIYANDTTATVELKGNMEQSGTPTPTTPIQPQECGERTANLFDKNAKNTANGFIQDTMLQSDGTTLAWNVFSVSEYIPVEGDAEYYLSHVMNAAFNAPSLCFYDSSKQFISSVVYQSRYSFAMTAPTTAVYMRISYMNTQAEDVMLNSGSAALPYEKFGYKIPISSGGVTTNVYLGEVQSTRQIKKYEFTGQETVYTTTETLNTQGLYCFGYQYSELGMTDIINYDLYMTRIPYPYFISSHFTNKSSDKRESFKDISDGEMGANSVNVNSPNRFLIVCVSGITSANEFKQWLADQYAAGTPVTVWYVLATPETAVVNEPIRKIGDYADEVSGITIPTIAGANAIDVDTTLKPSEVSVNYHGWHPVADVHDRDNGAWT